MKPTYIMNKTLLPVVLALLIGSWSCHGPSDHFPSSTAEAQKEEKLDQLFLKLKNAEDAYETKVLQSRIWEIWMTCHEQEIHQLMSQGIYAMAQGEYQKAAERFTQIIDKKPGFAEAWNKRATTLYMMGDLEAALEDIEKTLVLEERHFGALSGLAAIYMMEGKERKALKTYERIARISPAEPDIQKQIHYLRGKMGIAQI